MNALDFVFTPHNYLPSNFPFPFTIPATSTLADVASDVITVTTSIATIPEKTVLPTPETLPSFNTSSPLGFLLYVAAQSQRILVGGSTSGGLFGGPTRSYWMLTLFMYALVNRTMTYASVRRPIRLKFGQRLFLRAIPILFLLHCVMRILSCLRCQAPNKYPLPWPEPCLSTPQNVLWYTFKCICLSHFVETFCASLEMRAGPGDNGMTVVEYAFAFAETANVTPTPEILVAALLSVSGTLLTGHIVSLFNWHQYRLIPTMIHGIISLGYYIYTIISGRFVRLPSILILFQIPYILTLVLLCMCTFISFLAITFIGRRDLRTSILDGGVGVPGLNEDFYAWLFKWGVIALTSVQEATFLNENEALRMPQTTIIENQDLDLHQEEAIRSGIGFRREWIRTGTVSKHRTTIVSSRIQNFRSALYYVRATFRTYIALMFRWLNGQHTNQMRTVRENTPYSARGMTPYNEDEDPDYIFSDRDTSPSTSDDEEYEESVREGTSAPLTSTRQRFTREESPFEREVREPSPFFNETKQNRTRTARRVRDTTPFDTLEPNPPSSYNANPPTPRGVPDFSDEDESRDENNPPENPLAELFPDFAATMTSLLNPSSQAESEDSQLLMSHMSSQRVLTRSRYRDETESQRLESLVRHRRRQRRRSSNETEEDRFVAEVQKCAVCRTNPRVIVIWPCRCLALCDDCRQTLAVRNFSGCPCCRRKVASYSRIYIP